MSVFSPAGNTQTMAVANTSSSINVTRSNSVLRLYNAGPGVVFVKWTNNAADAATVAADMPIPAGDIEVFEKGATVLLYAISDTSATLYVTQGEGA